VGRGVTGKVVSSEMEVVFPGRSVSWGIVRSHPESIRRHAAARGKNIFNFMAFLLFSTV
jgi:hypothetical protein